MKFAILISGLLLGFSVNATIMPKADLVVVKKSQYSLTLYSKGVPLKRYWVALGPNPRGPKIREGDNKTPEGRYLLDYRKMDSNYYKAFHISYPSLNDMKRAQHLGVEPGGQILLHGQRKGSVMSDETLQRSNWTNGCIALINADMDELWESVSPGTPIEIRP
ncbi:ErfK/YbiS/YcfS/YnhG family protein [Tolumonas auensis DSM 9187]|uniref:ErfK/YbiS/YcfS/YnhG family protein n=2 Tax=Tolumonas TaxID=43947 RepID=C4L959_TOLAT|nr:L,D-transpeptidase family protein [Tolumonas auensis]ACQ91958.1 ErfK/YbiS/YcfS/YnhG family protein [Tolumonas auensis DSM 9187]